MKYSISIFLFAVCLMVLTPLYAGTQNLTAEYPSPTGNYLNLSIGKFLTFTMAGTTCTTPPLPSGSVSFYLDSISGLVQVCDSSGTGHPLAGLWNSATSSGIPYMYPVDSYPNVVIGAGGVPILGDPLVVHGGDANINGLDVGMGGSMVIGNTAVGQAALMDNSTGNSNTAVGYESLLNNSTGWSDTGLGAGALQVNATGHDNTGLGEQSLYSNYDGYGNSAVGSNAMNNNTSGIQNIAMGQYSLFYNTSGVSNTSLGTVNLSNNSTGSYNTAVGDSTDREDYSLFSK
jgi:hypothetical protein